MPDWTPVLSLAARDHGWVMIKVPAQTCNTLNDGVRLDGARHFASGRSAQWAAAAAGRGQILLMDPVSTHVPCVWTPLALSSTNRKSSRLS